MRSLLLFISRGVLVCLFMAILRVHALVVIPPEALPETLRTPEAGDDELFSAPGLGMAPHPAAAASDSLPVPSIPTVTRVLPSHAPWRAQSDWIPIPPGHAPGTQRILNGRIRIHDADADTDTEGNVLRSYRDSDSSSNSAPWAAKHRESESSPRGRRRRPGSVDDATDRERTSDDSKVSVFALAVVGIVLACHYLDYL